MSNYDYFNSWDYVDGVGNYITLSSKNQGVTEDEVQEIVDKSFDNTELKSEGQELQLSINGKNVSTVTIEDKYLHDVSFDEETKELIFKIDDGEDFKKIDLSSLLNEFATKSDVDNRVSELINGAPEALDTLQELSSALGEDPNFAATITNELSKKLNKETYEIDKKSFATKDDLNLKANVSMLDNYVENSSFIGVTNKTIENAQKIDTINEQLVLKADKNEIPTKVSELENDANYLTEHQSLENYSTKDELKSEIDKTVQFTTAEYQGRIKKVITLDNDELMNARSNSEDLEDKIDVNGKTISLIQLNRWNVVDLGSPYTLTNINTPDGVRPTIQEKSQSGREAHKMAYLSDYENINNIVNSLSTNVEMLQMKLDDINKSNIEIVEITNDVMPEMTDVTKDYIISGDINTTANISGKSIKLNNVSISNDARLNLNAHDIEIRDLNLNGDFPKTNGNSVVQINNAEFVLFKNIVFNSNNVHNGIEIGLLKTATQQSKNIIFENCQFKGEFANNAILIFATDNNSVITLNNCHFDKVSNALRISNRTNSKNVVININNCTIDGWDSNPEYQGFIIFEDYTNKTEEDVNANNLFAPEKITVNINNLTYQDKKLVPTDIASVCGTANENQIIYVYANAIGLIAYDSNKYPNISFN